jgi:nitric oxide reductase large subunit
MIVLINAIITVFSALLVIPIVLIVSIAFASLRALKMAHKAENRRIQNLQGRHIRR